MPANEAWLISASWDTSTIRALHEPVNTRARTEAQIARLPFREHVAQQTLSVREKQGQNECTLFAVTWKYPTSDRGSSAHLPQLLEPFQSSTGSTQQPFSRCFTGIPVYKTGAARDACIGDALERTLTLTLWEGDLARAVRVTIYSQRPKRTPISLAPEKRARLALRNSQHASYDQVQRTT